MKTIVTKSDKTSMVNKKHHTLPFGFEYYPDNICDLKEKSSDRCRFDEFRWAYVKSGSISCLIGTEEIRLNEGDCIFINSRVLHKFEEKNGAVMPNILFSSDIIAPRSSPVFTECISKIIFSHKDHLVFTGQSARDSEIIKLLKDVFCEASCKEPDKLSIQISVCLLWQELIKTYGEIFNQKSAESRESLSARARVMTHFIKDNYMQSVTLGDIANSADISKSEALRCFHTAVQTTPIAYLLSYRLDVAKHLLETTDDSVTQIAVKVGIDNISYFNRVFKKHCGVTPTAYRLKKEGK